MTVLQPDDLAEVFEHLGNACAKLSKILKHNPLNTNIAKNIEPVIEQMSTLISTESDSDNKKKTGTIAAISKRKRKSAAAIKDPDAPKRPPTAFILFCKERRAILAQQHPGLHFGEIAIKLGKEWEGIDQAPYYEKSNDLKKRYYSERDNYESGKSGNAVAADNAAAETPEAVESVLAETIKPVESAEMPKKKRSPVKKSKLEELPLTQETILSTAVELVAAPETIAPAVVPEPVAPIQPQPSGTASDAPKKKKKKPATQPELTASSSAVSQPVTVPTPAATQPIADNATQPAEPEKKKKKKKKIADVASQSSSTALFPPSPQ